MDFSDEDFIQQLEDIVYLIDMHGNFSFINPAIQKYGYSPEKLLGRHFTELFSSADDTIQVDHTFDISLQYPKNKNGASAETSRKEKQSQCQSRIITVLLKKSDGTYFEEELSEMGIYTSPPEPTLCCILGIIREHVKDFSTPELFTDQFYQSMFTTSRECSLLFQKMEPSSRQEIFSEKFSEHIPGYVRE